MRTTGSLITSSGAVAGDKKPPAAEASPSSASTTAAASKVVASTTAAASSSSSSSKDPPLATMVDSKPEKVTVKEQEQRLEKVRSQFYNTIHCVAFSLANSFNHRIMVGIGFITQAVTDEHFETVRMLGTQYGRLQWHANTAAGDYMSYLSKLVATPFHPQTLKKIGMLTPSEYNVTPNEFIAKEETQIADILWRVVRKLFTLEYESMRLYSCRLPGRCFALHHVTNEAQDDALEFCKKLTRTLENVEKIAENDAWLAS